MTHPHHAALGFSLSVFLTLILAFTEVLYLRGWLAIRSSAVKGSSGWRAFSFLSGLFLIWVAVASPIAGLDHELLTVHMLQHLLLMTLAPPLIWLGSPGGPMSHALSRRHIEGLLVLRQSRTAEKLGKLLGGPKFAWLAASFSLIGWHIPAIFLLGMQSAPWHLLEHLSFLATGLLFWWFVVQPSASTYRHGLWMILYLFFATLPCDILSGFLVFCDRVVYPMYFSSSHLLGLSPLEDQQCAAALMWTCVTVVYFVAGAILTMHLLAPQAFPEVSLVQRRLAEAGIGRRVSRSLEAV